MLTFALSFFFFFSSRRRHTRFDCDWSSDVCSSDLARSQHDGRGCRRRCSERARRRDPIERDVPPRAGRSEERRVGKSVDLGGRRIIKKKKRSVRKECRCREEMSKWKK